MSAFREFILQEAVRYLEESQLSRQTQFEEDEKDALKFDRHYGANKKFLLKIDGQQVLYDWPVHGKARFARRAAKSSFMHIKDLYRILDKIGRAALTAPKREVLIYSQSEEWGVIIDVFTNESPKRLRVVSWLPRKKHQPVAGTPLILAEAIERLHIIELD